MASSKDSVNVEILFVEDVDSTRPPRKINDSDDSVLHRLAMENRRFSVQRLRCAWQPNLNFAISRQAVNMKLVARAYRARRMVNVPR